MIKHYLSPTEQIEKIMDETTNQKGTKRLEGETTQGETTHGRNESRTK